MAAPLNVSNATLSQLQAAANQQAASSTRAAELPLQQQQAASNAQYLQQGRAIQGFSTALAQLLKGIGPQVQGDYSNAASEQGSLAHGFSQNIQDIINQAVQGGNDFSSQMGAPASALHPAPNTADVTYGLGGYIPGSAFNREGAAFTAAADMLPQQATHQGLQDFIANQYAGRAAGQNIQNQIAAVAGKQPAAAQSALTSLEGLQAKQQTLHVAKQRAATAAAAQQETANKTKLGVLLKQTDQNGNLMPSARAAVAKLLGMPVSAISSTNPAVAAKAISNAIAQGRLAETTSHDRATEATTAAHDKAMEATAAANAATSAGRANIAALSLAETKRYHTAMTRIQQAKASGKTPSAKDMRTAFVTAVKIGSKFLGKKTTLKVGSVSKTSYGAETPYPQALESMTDYWLGMGVDPATAAVQAKRTLRAIPGYKVS